MNNSTEERPFGAKSRHHCSPWRADPRRRRRLFGHRPLSVLQPCQQLSSRGSSPRSPVCLPGTGRSSNEHKLPCAGVGQPTHNFQANPSQAAAYEVRTIRTDRRGKRPRGAWRRVRNKPGNPGGLSVAPGDLIPANLTSAPSGCGNSQQRSLFHRRLDRGRATLPQMNGCSPSERSAEAP